MAAVSTAWFVGSVTIPVQDFTANGFACSIAAGTYYLRHTTSNLSLIDLFNTEVEDETGVSSNGTSVKQSRLVADSWTAPVAVVWGTATVLRDLLGHTANLASATSHIATNISPLLWSPGYPATPKTIPGVSGYTVDHKSQFKADDGSALYTDFYSEEFWQDLEWSHILPSRLRTTGTTAAQGGTFHQFYEQVAKLGKRFFHYESLTENTADSSTDVTWTTPQGPYVLREFSGDWYRRRVQGADVSSPLELPIHLVDELS